MAENIVPDNREPTAELMSHYASVLANFKNRMSLDQVQKTYNLSHRELIAAIENGWIRYYKRGTRYQLSHEFVAEYIENFCIFRNEPLPG